MVYTVKSPSETFNGKRAGVRFLRGVGTFEDKQLIPVFEGLGYEVTKPEVKKETKKETPVRKATTKKSGE